jgi:hypothetical protein
MISFMAYIFLLYPDHSVHVASTYVPVGLEKGCVMRSWRLNRIISRDGYGNGKSEDRSSVIYQLLTLSRVLVARRRGLDWRTDLLDIHTL